MEEEDSKPENVEEAVMALSDVQPSENVTLSSSKR
jgi:predicted GTPase